MVDSSFPAQDQSKGKLHTGSLLGEYRLDKLLEAGEAGQVFLARQTNSNILFRLRILDRPQQSGAESRMLYLGYFQKQANQVAALQHAHILPLLSYGTHQGIPYLAYQHYPMQTLSKYLAHSGPLNAQVAGSFLDQISSALECGHQHGILHRNLSVECIFIKQDGELVVADFGVLRLLEQSAGNQQNENKHADAPPARQNLLFGMNEASSPAPEQVAGGAVDTTADVYALGATLYRMLTGHRVFRGKTRQEIAQQHASAPVPPLSNYRQDLPPALESVIARAMSKDPRQRFARPGELANAYHQVVAPADSKRQPFAAPSMPALAPMRKEQPVYARDDKRTSMPRRKVLTFLVAGGSAAAAITVVSITGIHLLRGNTPSTGGIASTRTTGSTPAPDNGSTPFKQQGKVLAHVSDIPPNSERQFPLSSSNNPGLLIHLLDNRFVAFDSTCTHAGCAVNYNSLNQLLECPCHGAVFDPAKNASVVQGPATSPLASIPITVNADGSITTNGS